MPVIRTKDIPAHAVKLAARATKNAQLAELAILKSTHAGSKFSDFTTQPQKDDLLKMCALALGLVQSD